MVLAESPPAEVPPAEVAPIEVAPEEVAPGETIEVVKVEVVSVTEFPIVSNVRTTDTIDMDCFIISWTYYSAAVKILTYKWY